jgi:orotate phosphoribosyltransferase
VTDRDALLARLKRDAWRRGRIRLASGRESDFFIDCKQVILTAEGHRWVGALLCDGITTRWPPPDGPDGVAGVALGGCPLASAVALTAALRGLAWDALYVRKEPKDHGTAKRIEGRVGGARRVALVEDVITTGGSSLAAVGALRDEGYTVLGVLALVDRQEGGVEALAAAGVTATALYSRQDFLP